MKISRRDFLKWSAVAAAALKLNLDMDKFNTVMAAETDPPVIWLQGASCTGCSISMLNVTNPTTIDDVLLNKISMKFHPNLSTIAGQSAMQAIDSAANLYNGQFILVLEGAIHIGSYKEYCIIGENNGVDVTMYDAVMKYGPMAKYVVSAGTCSAFGGVPKSGVNSSTCASVKTILSGKTANPIVNLPGCPVHPTVLIQILIDLLLTGIPQLDSYNRH
ncbi:MAG: twin-arginine translocation signal domain-containing protein, partial [Bacillota bacterium]